MIQHFSTSLCARKEGPNQKTSILLELPTSSCFLDVFPCVSGVQKATVSTSYCPQEGAEGRDLNVQIWWFFDFLLFNLFIALLSIRFKMFSIYSI